MIGLLLVCTSADVKLGASCEEQKSCWRSCKLWTHNNSCAQLDENPEYVYAYARNSLTAQGRNAKVTHGVIVTVSDFILDLQCIGFLRSPP
jgi:hypothetical protein